MGRPPRRHPPHRPAPTRTHPPGPLPPTGDRRGRLHPVRGRGRQLVLPAGLLPLRTRLTDRHLEQTLRPLGEVFGDDVVAALISTLIFKYCRWPGVSCRGQLSLTTGHWC